MTLIIHKKKKIIMNPRMCEDWHSLVIFQITGLVLFIDGKSFVCY